MYKDEELDIKGFSISIVKFGQSNFDYLVKCLKGTDGIALSAVFWSKWAALHGKKVFWHSFNNRSFSAHVLPRSNAMCLDLWLKFPFGLPLTWANSKGSGEPARTYAVCICYNGYFPMAQVKCSFRSSERSSLVLECTVSEYLGKYTDSTWTCPETSSSILAKRM